MRKGPAQCRAFSYLSATARSAPLAAVGDCAEWLRSLPSLRDGNQKHGWLGVGFPASWAGGRFRALCEAVRLAKFARGQGVHVEWRRS